MQYVGKEKIAMKKKNTFYIDKKSNETAYILAGIIAESNMKNQIFNPVVIYGPSGNGKTHLCSIIASRSIERKIKVKVIKADDFISHLVNRMKSSNFSIMDFCKEFNEYSLLLFEDVDCLKEKCSSQECLLDIVERFINNGKQVVFTMNCNPTELSDFDQRLQTKFVSGIQVPIFAPSLEFKRRIIKNWSCENGCKFKKKFMNKVAKRAASVADLLGILKQIEFYVEYYGFEVNKQLINRILKERGLKGVK